MKEKWIFACQSCGQKYSKWMGRCQDCGEWNTVQEERKSPEKGKKRPSTAEGQASVPKTLSEVATENIARVPSDLSELDTVLGGGLVPGSVVLVGGEPGVGKSTLVLQLAEQYARQGKRVLYATGEESISQIALRSTRVGSENPNIFVVAESILEKIVGHVEQFQPDILIVDSIQTIYSELLESHPGGVGQLRECTFELVDQAKTRGMAVFLIGHVTKDGAIAGPKLLEHMVDVVLYFESTTSQTFRMLRSMKNRYGSTNEVALFDMVSTGIKQITNPSEMLLAERPKLTAGSVVGASLEGSRPLLVEVQGLVSHSGLTIPRRTAIGLDPNRVSLLVAILEKRAGFRLYDQDVYVNIAGGLRLSEPAMDLAVAAALISSHTGRSTEEGSVFFGEIGLGGEVRSVPRAAIRIKEIQRVGLKTVYLPKRVVDELGPQKGVSLVPISNVQDLAKLF